MALLKRQADKVDVLAKVPLFAGLGRKELASLARLVTEVDVPAGDMLAVEGEVGREAYVILSGAATVRRKGRKLAELGPGDVVGEISLVTRAPRNASVRAETFMSVLHMDSRDFSSLMDEHPAVAVKVLKTVADRLVAQQAPV